jgi:hypothetical protein
MKRFLVILLTATGVVAGSLFAQEKPQLAGFQSLITNPDLYQGRTVALHGIVGKPSPNQKTFTIIDLKTGSGVQEPPGLSLTATIRQGSEIVMPENGQEAIVIGTIEKQDDVISIKVTDVITNKDAVRQFLRPIAKKPRPGDDLGRDAQPSDHISQ